MPPQLPDFENDPRPPYESELISVTLVDFLRLGRELDPFSNWVLAGAGAVLFLVFNKYGQPDAPLGRVASLLVFVPLVLSIGAGFLARYLSFQGLVLARQRDRHPQEVERIAEKYYGDHPKGPPLRHEEMQREIQRFFPSKGLPLPLWLRWPMIIMNWLVGSLIGSNEDYLQNIDPSDEGLGVTAYGIHRTLPLVVAQMFFLVLAVLVALTALSWHEIYPPLVHGFAAAVHWVTTSK